MESVALELKVSSRKHIDMPNYVCRTCIGSTTCGPTQTVSVIAHKPIQRKDYNSTIVSHVFESRQVFLTVCLSYHYQFDQVTLRIPCDGVVAPRHVQYHDGAVPLLQPHDSDHHPHVQPVRVVHREREAVALFHLLGL